MSDAKNELRKDIRSWLDKLEPCALDGDGMFLTAKRCTDLAHMLRRIQDEAAKDLGYDP